MGKSINSLSQSELVYTIKSNDPNVLKFFYTENYTKIESLILKNSGSIEYAKDIYQDAFNTVWKYIKNEEFVLKNDTALQGYLYKFEKKWIDVVRSKSFKNFKSLNYETLVYVKDESNKLLSAFCFL